MIRKGSLILLSLVISLIVVMAPNNSTQAYNWSSPYLKWYQTTVNYEHTALPFDWRTQVTLAAYTWNAAPANFNFYYGTSTNTWTQYNYGQTSPLALTSVYGPVNPPDQITRCTTVFNTYNTFTIGGNNDIQTIALHEFGNWLSMGHIPWWQFWNSSIVMYEWYSGLKQSLHQDDINGIVAIYGY